MTIYAPAHPGLPLKSIDGGAHWSALAEFPSGVEVRSMVADPKKAGLVYVATDSGVFLSPDGGTSWAMQSINLDSLDVDILAISPSSPKYLYAATGGGCFVSDSGGDDWRPTSLATPSPQDLVVNPRDPSDVIAVTALGAFRTHDYGIAWSPLVVEAGASVNVVVFDRSDPSVLYAGGHKDGSRLYVSRDVGSTWQVLASGPPSAYIGALASISSSTLLAGFSLSSGVYRSDDAGRSWASSNAGLNAVPLIALAATAADASRVYAGAGDGRIFRTDDGGVHWKETSPVPGSLGINDIAADPHDPATAYAIAIGPGFFPKPYNTVGLFTTNDAGLTWRGAFGGANGGGVIAVDPVNPSTLYIGAGLMNFFGFGLYKSTDGGLSVTELDDGLPLGFVDAIAIDPVMPPRVYVAMRGLYRSDNAGLNWVPTALGDAAVLRVLVGFDVNSTVLAVSNGNLVRSTDLGATWTPTTGLPNDIRMVLVSDPGDDQLFYAGTSNGLVFRSVDGGATWSRLDQPALPGPIVALSCPRAGLLYAGTNAGAYSISFTRVRPVPVPTAVPVEPRVHP